MPDEPQIPQAPVPQNIQEQILQQHIQRHFEFRNSLRFLRTQMFLWSIDGPIEPQLGAMILHEIEGMATIIRGGLAKPEPAKQETP